MARPAPPPGMYDTKEGFFELLTPLARDLPGARSFDLNAAVRYTDYGTSGGVTTSKVGTSYQPVDDLRLRATRSRDIRAPNVAELFSGSVQSQGSVIDPQGGNASAGVPSAPVLYQGVAPLFWNGPRTSDEQLEGRRRAARHAERTLARS